MSHQLKQKLPKLKDIIESTRTQSEWDIIRGFKNDTNKMSKKLGDDFRKSFAQKVQGFQGLDILWADDLVAKWIAKLDQKNCFNHKVDLSEILDYDPWYCVPQGGWIDHPDKTSSPYVCIVNNRNNLPDKRFDLIARYMAIRDNYPRNPNSTGYIFHLILDGNIATEEIVLHDEKYKDEFWARVRQFHKNQRK